MIFQNFYQNMLPLGVINHHQVRAWYPKFDKNNFGRWVKKGWLIKLKNGFYTFPELLSRPNFQLFVANRIYRPSYVSLQSALAFYGLIPEAVFQITSVTTRKTATFENQAGTCSYLSIKPEIMFGFNRLPFDHDKSILIAKPEKALLDLLYLYPFYTTKIEIEQLRLDDSILQENVDLTILYDYLQKYQSRILAKRVENLQNVYQL